MTEALRAVLQLVMYAAFAVCIGYFATLPAYRYADPANAVIKLSLSHAANLVEPCVQLTPEQIAELAANMRKTEACERERLPLVVELDIDGDKLLSLVAEPSGLWNDGPASVYRRIELSPGSYQVSARLRDTARTEGWDYEATTDVVLEAGRYFAVTFRPSTGGFSFR